MASKNSTHEQPLWAVYVVAWHLKDNSRFPWYYTFHINYQNAIDYWNKHTSEEDITIDISLREVMSYELYRRIAHGDSIVVLTQDEMKGVLREF